MTITVCYQGQIRQVVGTESQQRSYDKPIPVDRLIADLAAEFGPDFAEMILEDGKIRPFILVLINGEAIDQSSSPLLNDGDEIAFLPPLAGG